MTALTARSLRPAQTSISALNEETDAAVSEESSDAADGESDEESYDANEEGGEQQCEDAELQAMIQGPSMNSVLETLSY